MKPSLTLCLAALTVALPAGAVLAQQPGPTSAAGNPMPKGSPAATPATKMAGSAMAATSADYVKNAAAGDMFEIQSSQVAMQKASNPQVREFAKMMVDHHTKTSADLMAAVKQANMPAPPQALPADKAQMVEGLRAGSPTGFDDKYIQEQLAAHQEALALHQAYARSGDNAALRTVANKAAPIVQQHLTQLQGMRAGASGGASTRGAAGTGPSGAGSATSSGSAGSSGSR